MQNFGKNKVESLGKKTLSLIDNNECIIYSMWGYLFNMLFSFVPVTFKLSWEKGMTLH